MESDPADYRRWTGPQVWDGAALRQNNNWTTILDQSDLLEIDAAVNTTRPLGDLTRADFPFGGLGDRLLALRDEVMEGRGFAVIRGLPQKQWSHEKLVRVYWGIGLWLGDPVSQNARGDLLGHIIDQRTAPSPGKRVYQTSQALSFHSDSCDIAGLLCLRKAKQGGASSVASAAAIHNALLDDDPDALRQLYGIFHCDRYDEIPAGKQPSYPVQVFNEVDGKMVCCGMDPDIRSAQRLEDVESLSANQVAALDTFQKTANNLALHMDLEPGDIQLVNNLTVVHARECYEDAVDPEQRRYLIRLWLSSPLGRALPTFMAERWGNIQPGTVRGGIIVPGVSPGICLNADQ